MFRELWFFSTLIFLILSGCIEVEMFTPTSENQIASILTSCVTATGITTPPVITFTPEPVPGENKVSNKDEMIQIFNGAMWVDRTEVTNAMYKYCVDEGSCTPPGPPDANKPHEYFDVEKYNDYPVVRVSFNQASDYCDWAGRRIPSGQEWKMAAGIEIGNKYPWGDTYPNCDLANFRSEGGYCIGSIDHVGLKPEGLNDVKLFDLAGNVAEWVSDTCPLGSYVYGGSYNDQAEFMEIENPQCRGSNQQSTKMGFRCVED